MAFNAKNVVHELTAELNGKPLVGRILAVGMMDRDEKRDRILGAIPGVVVVDTNADTGYEIRWTA